jgi:hypothetical protein
MSDSNKNVIIGPRWVTGTTIDVGRNITSDFEADWGYSWVTLFLEEINKANWPSRFGESQI